MSAPIEGGVRRRTLKGLPAGPVYSSHGRALYWESRRPYPDNAVDLRYFIPEIGRGGTIENYGFISSRSSMPTECQGKVYRVRNAPPGEGHELEEFEPYSSASRIILMMKERGIMPASESALRERDGRLYFLFTKYDEQARHDPESGYEAVGTYIALVQPGAPLAKTIGPMFDFQGTWWLTKEHVYYVVVRERKTILDHFNTDYSGRTEYEIHRMRLPQ
jgi:hypothetical protein